MEKTDESKNDLAPGLGDCLLLEAVETSCRLEEVSGEIPGWVLGSFYVNGPARFERDGFRYKHWLDGDGMVCALHFTDRGVHFVNRFVETRKLREERAAGRPLYRTFGTRFPGDQLRRGLMLEPPVNVSAYPFADTLLAFGEQCLPMELDPLTLETVGEYDFRGSLNEVSPFSAHPKIDPDTEQMVNFGINFISARPVLHVYEFNPDGSLKHRSRHRLSRPHTNHDFGLTDTHTVFYLSPLLMDFESFAGKGLSVMESLRWVPEEGTQILVVPRWGENGKAFEIEIGSGHCLHLINCSREGRQLTMDVLEMDSPVYPEYQPIPDLYSSVCPCQPVRYLIDLDAGGLMERTTLNYRLASDFPTVDTRLISQSYQEFWMLGISATGQPGRKFFDQLVHCSWNGTDSEDLFQTEAGTYLAGDPVYLPDPTNPSSGIVLVHHLDPGKGESSFLLFESQQVSKGPVARLLLPHMIHPGFHGSFWPSPPHLQAGWPN